MRRPRRRLVLWQNTREKIGVTTVASLTQTGDSYSLRFFLPHLLHQNWQSAWLERIAARRFLGQGPGGPKGPRGPRAQRAQGPQGLGGPKGPRGPSAQGSGGPRAIFSFLPTLQFKETFAPHCKYGFSRRGDSTKGCRRGLKRPGWRLRARAPYFVVEMFQHIAYVFRM